MTAHGWSLRCTGCGRAVAPGLPDYCEACGGPVEDLLESLPPSAGIFDGRVTDSWKYVSLYPVAASPPFSLGEGGTPLVGRRLLLLVSSPSVSSSIISTPRGRSKIAV